MSNSIPLLTTKLTMPPQRPNLVRRPHLVRRLNQGLELGHILTLVSAPAGFGKTTLVGEWAGAGPGKEDRPVGWLSLDERDNDLARFLTYFLAIIDRTTSPRSPLGKGAMAMLHSSRPPPVEDILTALINDIAANGESIILVLDDYHLLDSPPIDKALTFLLDHLPPQLHLVIVTRSDPDLPISRLRARGQLTELRAADLRFTAAEVNVFLNEAMGLTLTPGEIGTLESRTEGWIAGLQLAALSMQNHEDSAAFIRSFAGSHHFVMDYLVEDVLEQQPAPVQQFLLETAILDRLTAGLCEAVTGQEDGQATLEQLERGNLFLVGLDGERRWYRYHHLFADLLRRRLRQTRSESAAALHRRASEWYEENGYAAEAIDHALQAEAYAEAIGLLETHVEAFWGRGENQKAQGWLDRLPEEVLFASPTLTIFQARYQCNTGRVEAAERSLEAVGRALAVGDGNGPAPAMLSPPSPLTVAARTKLRGRMATTRALICSYQGDSSGIIHHAERALAQLPADDLTWRSVTAILLGNAHGFRGDMPAAYAARLEALRACEAAGDIYFIVLANLELAITLREQGQLRQTIEICRRQQATAREHGLLRSRTVGWLLAVWGETLAEVDEPDEALERAQQGFALTRRSGNLQMLGWSFMCLARILLSRGDLTGAEEAIGTMTQVAREYQMPPWITDQVAAWQARVWLAQGRLELAAGWAETHALQQEAMATPADEIGFFPLFDYILLARILMAQGRPEEASRLLSHLLAAAEAGGRTSSAIAISILHALALQAGGDTERALGHLRRALVLAESQGFVRIFVDEGSPLVHLLYQALARGLAPDYVRRLLAAFPAAEAGPNGQPETPVPAGALVEPLSERELEVLEQIAAGLTNRQIAERLYLSLNTVKAHTRNIYAKLDVHSRTQAVARCQELGILPRGQV